MVMWFYSEKMLLNLKKNGLKNCLSMFMLMVNILCYIFVIIK